LVGYQAAFEINLEPIAFSDQIADVGAYQKRNAQINGVPIKDPPDFHGPRLVARIIGRGEKLPAGQQAARNTGWRKDQMAAKK
jgi:hypothetical protein